MPTTLSRPAARPECWAVCLNLISFSCSHFWSRKISQFFGIAHCFVQQRKDFITFCAQKTRHSYSVARNRKMWNCADAAVKRREKILRRKRQKKKLIKNVRSTPTCRRCARMNAQAHLWKTSTAETERIQWQPKKLRKIYQFSSTLSAHLRLCSAKARKFHFCRLAVLHVGI